MAAPPPAYPPTASPPAVPDGWKAEWSPEYNTWYYQNLSTQGTQWEPPMPPAQQNLATQIPPQQQYGDGFASQQGYPSPPADGVGGADGPDGERGLGKVIVGGGLLALAGTVLHSALKKHEPEQEKPHKSSFGFFNSGPQAPMFGAVSGFFAGSDNKTTAPSYPSPPPAAGPPAGGFFSGITSHIPTAMTQGNDPPLHIHCAAYADRDVTQVVCRMVTPAQSIEFNTDKLIEIFGDPWPENDTRQFSVLYSYGQRPWELVASSDRQGTWSLIPHQPLDKARMEFVQDPNGRLVAVVWGRGNGLQGGKGTVEKVKEIETTGEFEATNGNFGFDGMCGPAKNAIAYYKTPQGGIAIATARENGTLRMPWNPLAKWT